MRKVMSRLGRTDHDLDAAHHSDIGYVSESTNGKAWLVLIYGEYQHSFPPRDMHVIDNEIDALQIHDDAARKLGRPEQAFYSEADWKLLLAALE